MLPWEPSRALVRLLSGIEAGVIGGMAMLALLIAGSLTRGDPWWTTPNLLGTTFYGMRAFRGAPNYATLVGGALHFVISGAVGAAFGLVCGEIQPRRRLVLLGTVAGLVWYGLADVVFWRQVNPLVPLYSPQPATLLSHALFGACLGSMGRPVGRSVGRPVISPVVPAEIPRTNTFVSPDPNAASGGASLPNGDPFNTPPVTHNEVE